MDRFEEALTKAELEKNQAGTRLKIEQAQLKAFERVEDALKAAIDAHDAKVPNVIGGVYRSRNQLVRDWRKAGIDKGAVAQNTKLAEEAYKAANAQYVKAREDLAAVKKMQEQMKNKETDQENATAVTPITPATPVTPAAPVTSATGPSSRSFVVPEDDDFDEDVIFDSYTPGTAAASTGAEEQTPIVKEEGVSSDEGDKEPAVEENSTEDGNNSTDQEQYDALQKRLEESKISREAAEKSAAIAEREAIEELQRTEESDASEDGDAAADKN